MRIQAQPSKTMSVRIPLTDHDAITELAAKTGRPISFYVKEAIQLYLASDLKGIYESYQIAEDAKTGKEKTYTLEELNAEYGI